jgi:hypothetical protein
MDVWEQWSALLVPHPNPHLFTGKKRLYRPSSSDSRSSFMSSHSDGSHGTQKRRKLTKTRPTLGPPPEIEPFSFEHEPMVDMTTNIFDFFPFHDTSNVNDLDGNLMSQSGGRHISLSLFDNFIIISFPTQVIPRAPALTSRLPSQRVSRRLSHRQL